MSTTSRLQSGTTVVPQVHAWFQYRLMAISIARRIAPSVDVFVSVLIIRGMRNRSAAALGNEAFVTGYALVMICGLLMLLGVRKRLVTVPLGRIAIWQRAHHYLGLLCVAAYVLHANLIVNGWLESILAMTFWAISLSGFLAWYVNKSAPRLLRAAGDRVLRQDIPERIRAIHSQAYQLALKAAGRSDTAALADHFGIVLNRFMSTRRGLVYRFMPSGTLRRRLTADLENLDRYLSEEGQSLRRDLSVLLQAKDNLDFQSAIQNRVRFFAAMHAWLLGGFLVLTFAHALLAHRFASAW